MAGNYTIDPSQPYAGTNFQTFNQAISALHCGGVSDSVIIIVSPGTYTEQLRIWEISGAGPDDRVIFRSSSSDSTQVVLQWTGTYTSNFVLYLDGADYINFEGITIKALDTY